MQDNRENTEDGVDGTFPGGAVVLNDWVWELDAGALGRKLRLKEGSKRLDELRMMVREAQSIGRPKALYREAFIESKGEDWVAIDGIRLQSRVLRVNVEQVYRVFPYLATGGVELASWVSSQSDLLRQFWADAISEAALRLAMARLRRHLLQQYQLGRISAMAPGSLADWPLEEQGPLFALLGDTEGAIGVRLTERFLMIPTKSVSGVFFPTESSFESCQLCTRERCPGRRAPYDPALYETKYGRREPDRTA